MSSSYCNKPLKTKTFYSLKSEQILEASDRNCDTISFGSRCIVRTNNTTVVVVLRTSQSGIAKSLLEWCWIIPAIGLRGLKQRRLSDQRFICRLLSKDYKEEKKGREEEEERSFHGQLQMSGTLRAWSLTLLARTNVVEIPFRTL